MQVVEVDGMKEHVNHSYSPTRSFAGSEADNSTAWLLRHLNTPQDRIFAKIPLFTCRITEYAVVIDVKVSVQKLVT